jgi:hypothetical protein
VRPFTDIGRFVQLPAAERRLIFRALRTVVTVRVRLALSPFPVVDRATSGQSMRATRGANAPVRVGWAVRAVSRYVPGATCLTQALAARSLLAAEGRSSRLQLGMALIDGRPQAHAWLESEGAIVIGGEGHTQFAQFKPTARTPNA